MLSNHHLRVWTIGLALIALLLGRLNTPKHFHHSDLIIALVIIFILFGHRLPRLMRHLGNDPPGGFGGFC